DPVLSRLRRVLWRPRAAIRAQEQLRHHDPPRHIHARSGRRARSDRSVLVHDALAEAKRAEQAQQQGLQSQAALTSARGEAQEFAKARQNFPTDYTTITRLGKAVPADPDIPSLIVQLD